MTWETSVTVSAVAIAAWLVSYALVLISTRWRALKPDPATEDLRPESPAVVSLLINRFQPASDMAEATLLDLGSRRYLEYRQPEPDRTSVHIGPEYPSGLTAYEQQVFDRVSGAADRGVVPLNKLSFDDLAKTALNEAQEAGLCGPRFDLRALAWLGGGAVVAAGVVGGSILWATGSYNGIVAGFCVLLALLGLVAAGYRMNHTPAGVEAAQHWLGVREFMRGHKDFGSQAAMTVSRWERYLAYGAALGVAHGAALIYGDRRMIWSLQRGFWRRVRVEYPRGWDRYGRSSIDLLRQAGTRLAVGLLILVFWRPTSVPLLRLGLVVGGYFALRGVYLLVRSLADLALQRTVSGEVLRIEPWRPERFSIRSIVNRELYVWRTPRVSYVVIDDGRSDRVTAWALPLALARGGGSPSGGIKPGQTVRARVLPWSRRVTQVH